MNDPAPTKLLSRATRRQDRNINRFGQPHQSGDDWQETIEAQLGYLRSAGFASITVPWQEDMWAIFAAVKATE